jgi:hypothetical protein
MALISTKNDLLTVIHELDLTDADLLDVQREISLKIRRIRAQKTRRVKQTLYSGARVEWTGKKGLTERGVVESNGVKRKYVHITTDAGARWRVAMSLVQVII